MRTSGPHEPMSYAASGHSPGATASCFRSSRCTALPKVCGPMGSRTRSPERRSSPARAAESRTSSSEGRRPSAWTAAFSWLFGPAPRHESPCNSLLQGRSRRRASRRRIRLRRGGRADRSRSRHARLVRDLGRRQEGVRDVERPRARDPPVGRRGRARVQGPPHRGESARRRPLRARQHLPVSRSRGRSVRASTSRRSSTGWTRATCSIPSIV